MVVAKNARTWGRSKLPELVCVRETLSRSVAIIALLSCTPAAQSHGQSSAKASDQPAKSVMRVLSATEVSLAVIGKAIRTGDLTTGKIERFEPDGSYILLTGQWGASRATYSINQNRVCVHTPPGVLCRKIGTSTSKVMFWLYENGNVVPFSLFDKSNGGGDL